ncbi:hypothetical protein KY285_016599 [Solanum tuberosum]|nr:hypothetical protein KY284_016609 [Solanum tuberosum]KAH0702321.1 hypothetical protein KY285_016599 [Solanum tuberosum]
MEIGKLRNLGYLNLSDNKLQGQIPTSIGTCVKLEALDLNNNNFQGSIPSTMNSLRGLGLLVLSHNNLSGGIPGFLKDFKFLQILNLSSNTLEGAVPTGGIFSNATVVSIIGNRNLCGGVPELDLPACVVEVKKERKSELGMGSDPSIYGDVYSFGILLLEMFTGRRPTDEMFKDNFNLHNYANATLPDRVMHITDPILLQERDEL